MTQNTVSLRGRVVGRIISLQAASAASNAIAMEAQINHDLNSAPRVKVLDEARNITPRMMRAVERSQRKANAMQGWFNWYANRGHLYGSGAMLRSAMRRVSWRRKF